VGSGEYLPQMLEIDRALLAGRSPRMVQLATASVPDGDAVVDKWHRLGREHALGLGVEAVVLDVRTREDADDPALAAQVSGSGLVYLSGGNPSYLADTLRDTAVWAAILAAWRDGAALAGCSAGAMVMASWVPSLRHPREGGTEGLAVLPHLRVIPHFDAFIARMPDFLTNFLVPRDPSVTVLGIDENTALVGGPTEWTVQGRSSVWRLTGEGREELPTGTTVTTPA
jgi:cyanophycinase